MRFDTIEPVPIVYEAHQQTVLKESLRELGLQEDILLAKVHGIQWTISFQQNPEMPDVISNLLKLEKLLQQKTRRSVDIRLLPKKDKNNRQGRNVLWKAKDESK